MAITYGFFNSLNGDRKYNSDQMSEYFDGMISDGVFANVGDALQVKASTGMDVKVQTGRAFINSRWMKNDAIHTITLNAAHVTLNRYTAIVIRLDASARTIDIVAVDGNNATSPTKPTMTNSTTVKELCLAYIYVAAGATTITQANIEDTRANTDLCGWVTGIIKQVDTSQLFLQWQNAYDQYFADMEAWQAEQKALFDEWFSTLTGQLQVNTYIKKYSKAVETTTEEGVFALDMDGYNYEESDILFINVNGIMLVEDYDYIINTTTTTPEVHLRVGVEPGNLVEITALKSVIGQI